MKDVSTIGIDLAKSCFHIWAIDKRGKRLFNKKLSRHKLIEFMANTNKCVVAMEACGTAHFWGRKMQDMGHDTKLINPKFVKAFVKGNKNDFNDAEAICEAATRPSMRFVPIKTVEQQDLLAVHSARELVISNRTRLANHLRSLLAERGLICNQGISSLMKMVAELISPLDNRLSVKLRLLVTNLYEDLAELTKKKLAYDKELNNTAKNDPDCKRLMQIPGIGPICATALVASVGKGYDFKNGRQMSAWLGLVPRQDTTGGKPKLLGISKRGNQYIRKQLIHGARAVINSKTKRSPKLHQWVEKLKARKHRNIVTVAVANKNARIAWAMLKSGEDYKAAA